VIRGVLGRAARTHLAVHEPVERDDELVMRGSRCGGGRNGDASAAARCREMTDELGHHEEPPSHFLDPRTLTDDDLERELTLSFEGADPQRLDYLRAPAPREGGAS